MYIKFFNLLKIDDFINDLIKKNNIKINSNNFDSTFFYNNQYYKFLILDNIIFLYSSIILEKEEILDIQEFTTKSFLIKSMAINEAKVYFLNNQVKTIYLFNKNEELIYTKDLND